MLRSVSLVNYQSHQNTHLELGPFTVVIGSSSSGKSAVVRAIRLVAENARGVSYVRQGSKVARVSLEFGSPDIEHPTAVTVIRGKNVSEYELALPGASEPTVFTKCSTNVPDALAEVMGFGDSKLWLAGQFDRPFLLDETGSAVAAVLGKLTNVTMIFAAVRECNRRASEASRRHKTVSAELTEIRTSLVPFVGLSERLAAGRAAESVLDEAGRLAVRRARLDDHLSSLISAGSRVRAVRASSHPVPDVTEVVNLSERRARLTEALVGIREAAQRRLDVYAEFRQVPEVESLALASARRASLRSALAVAAESRERRHRLADESRRASEALVDARERFSASLVRAGSCPLCGAEAAHAQIDQVV